MIDEERLKRLEEKVQLAQGMLGRLQNEVGVKLAAEYQRGRTDERQIIVADLLTKVRGWVPTKALQRLAEYFERGGHYE